MIEIVIPLAAAAVLVSGLLAMRTLFRWACVYYRYS
jgi:hypothetical protein